MSYLFCNRRSDKKPSLKRDTKSTQLLLCCSNVVQVPLSLNPFQLNLEFGTTHRVALCVVHPRYTKSNRIYNKSQN